MEVKLQIPPLPKILPTPMKLGKGTYARIGDIVESAILENVQKQKQGDGSPLKKNHPATLARKQAQGRPQISLRDVPSRRTFTRAGTYRTHVKPDSCTTEMATAEGAEINRKVQAKGYTGFFALNAKAVGKITKLVAKRLRQMIRQETRKHGGP